MPKHPPPPVDVTSPAEPTNTIVQPKPSLAAGNTHKSKIHFDWHEWLHHMDSLDATDAQKQEYAETLWLIVLCFVDLGWEIDNQLVTIGKTADLALGFDKVGQVDNSTPILDLSAALEASVLQSMDSKPSQPTPKKETSHKDTTQKEPV